MHRTPSQHAIVESNRMHHGIKAPRPRQLLQNEVLVGSDSRKPRGSRSKVVIEGCFRFGSSTHVTYTIGHPIRLQAPALEVPFPVPSKLPKPAAEAQITRCSGWACRTVPRLAIDVVGRSLAEIAWVLGSRT